jgi:hypothetical protein
MNEERNYRINEARQIAINGLVRLVDDPNAPYMTSIQAAAMLLSEDLNYLSSRCRIPRVWETIPAEEE